MKIKLIALATLSFSLMACDAPLPQGSGAVGALSKFDVNLHPLNALVCDPFGATPPVSASHGIRARLYSLKAGERYYTAGEYIQKGTRSSQDFFFTQLNVPTRMFYLGFPTETGDIVKGDDGQILQEFFAFQFSTILRKDADQEAGEYELALLSDDGAKFQVREGDGDYVDYVDNDGDHPTRFACGTKTLQMNSESEHVVNMTYYQGPRYHISMIPMWRKIVAGQTAEPLCGATGNNTFFNPDNNSVPQQAYKDLESRGWKPIAASNYHLPNTVGSFNPCVQAEPTPISNLKAEADLDGGVIVSWTTSKPATSQVLYKVVNSNSETLTKSDNILRTDHRVRIPEPQMGQSYLVRAVSITNEYGKSTSSPVNFP